MSFEDVEEYKEIDTYLYKSKCLTEVKLPPRLLGP